MARACTLVPLVGGLALAAAMLIAARSTARGAVYTVAEVQDHLARTPGVWAGRTMLVQGVFTDCGPLEAGADAEPDYCLVSGLIPSAEESLPASNPLPVSWAGPATLLAVLRRVPLLGQLVPPPQAVRWGVVATYRVQLREMPAGSCPFPRCYAGLLLDDAP